MRLPFLVQMSIDESFEVTQEYLDERLITHASYTEYRDKLRDYGELILLFAKGMADKTIIVDDLDKDAVVTYLHNGVHWAKQPRREEKRARKEQFECHCRHIFQHMSATRGWTAALNVPDKYDKRTFLIECVLQNNFGLTLLPYLLKKFKVDLAPTSGIYERNDGTIYESKENAVFISTANYLLPATTSPYNYQRWKAIMTLGLEDRPDMNYDVRQEIMSAKNYNNFSAYSTLSYKSHFILNNNEHTEEILAFVKPWCTRSSFQHMFH